MSSDDAKPAQNMGQNGPTLGRRPWHHRHRDFQPFDEVRIFTVPRWKDSYLSGAEYRYHAQVQFMRKGRVFFESSARDVEAALAQASVRVSDWLGNGNYGEVERDHDCDQEGCSDPATVIYLLRSLFSRDGYERKLDIQDPSDQQFARFCERHRRRGDCSLEDGDHNYVEIKIADDGSVIWLKP